MKSQLLYFAVIFVTMAAACKKNNGAVSTISIDDFNISAPKDSIIEISGHGFGKTPAENTVSFPGVTGANMTGVMGMVVAASDSVLRIKVPRLAGSGPITIRAHGASAISPGTFTYVYTVSTFAGSGVRGAANGTGTSASFGIPLGLCADPSGNVYVADLRNVDIRKITPAGVVSFYDNGAKSALYKPEDIAYGKNGDVYIADYANKILKVDMSGVVSVIAGDTSGYKDGKGSAALFNTPFGIDIDHSGNLLVADSYNHRIRKVTPDGTVSTIAGSGTRAHTDGPALSAAFSYPQDVAVAPDGSIYVADGDYTIRKIGTDGTVSSMAGSSNFYGKVDGTGTTARLGSVNAIICDDKGLVYFTDYNFAGVRTMDASGTVRTLCGQGVNVYKDGLQSDASFNEPYGIVKASDGTIYVSDSQTPRIRKID